MPVKSATCFKKDGEPLSTYFSEQEAVDGASHVRFAYGLEVSPYQCAKCGYWHLSPKDRQTPSRSCRYCTDSQGKPKELYETKTAAESRAKIIEKERGIRLKVYKCPNQEGWHLTKNVAEYW